MVRDSGCEESHPDPAGPQERCTLEPTPGHAWSVQWQEGTAPVIPVLLPTLPPKHCLRQLSPWECTCRLVLKKTAAQSGCELGGA